MDRGSLLQSVAFGAKSISFQFGLIELGCTLRERGKTMKKILLATTAVVLTAGVAAAEVKLSGDARFGIQYNESGFAGGEKTALEKRFRVNLDGVMTSDAGVTFGGRARVTSDENVPGATGTVVSGARVYAQYEGLTVQVGNILGAIDNASNMANWALTYSLTGLGFEDALKDSSGFDGFTSAGNGAEGAEVMYKAGDLSFHLSHSSADLTKQADAAAERTAAAIAWNYNGWTLTALAQGSNVEGEDFYGFTAGGRVADFGLNAALFNVEGEGADTGLFYRFGGDYAFGATSVGAFVSKYENNNEFAYGIGARYNLGGGAAVVGGIANAVTGAAEGATETRADLGVTFSF